MLPPSSQETPEISSAPRSPRAARLTATLAGIYAIFVGFVVLLGWALDLPRLTDWTGQGISMFVNTALGAMLGGAALLLLAQGTARWRKRAARAAGIVVAIIGSLTLVQHLTGRDLGIDTLLLERDWGQNAAMAPMRMGPPASTSFLLLGAALALLTYGRRARRLAFVLAMGTSVIALLSLTGYALGVDQLYGIARYTGISLLTSTVVAVLSVGVIASLPELGITAALRRDDAGGAILRHLIVPILLTPLVLGWLRLRGEQAGFYDTAFGTAMRTLAEIVLFFLLLWWAARSISGHASAAEKAGARLAAIIESSEDAIISKSLGGVIESWNAGAERVFGYAAEEAIGQHISLIIPPERIEEEARIVERLKRAERIEHFETVRRRKDGGRIHVSLTISPVRDDGGAIIGASKIARDVTEWRRLESDQQELLASERAARAEAERASHLKDEFLATLSHELRTPLNAILGWAQVLSVSESPEDVTEGLEAIERNARAQAQLIEDLLDMSRIISGKVRLDVQSTDLATVVDGAVAAVTPAADAKEIRLRKILNPHAGPVSGDPTRLQQVVWNLLSNAIKFTPRGGTVDIVLERVGSHVRISVRDTGIGIAPENLPVVFERFRQVDSSTTRRHSGLGLGLSIVKQLVELHGGTIEAHSDGEGYGATFVVSLPVSPVRSFDGDGRTSPARVDDLDRHEINLTGLRVLVVDDEADARALVRRVLSQRGAEVGVASSAADGLEQLRSFRPHVLVSDIGMPDMDGYQFIREVRQRTPDEGGVTPAIALTAFARSEDRMRSMIAGFQMHLTKPIEPQELVVAVGTFGERGRT